MPPAFGDLLCLPFDASNGSSRSPQRAETETRLARRDASFVAAAATERGLPLWAVGAAKRKPVLGVERQFDDRSWVNEATGGPLAAAAETAFHGVGKRVEQFGAVRQDLCDQDGREVMVRPGVPQEPSAPVCWFGGRWSAPR